MLAKMSFLWNDKPLSSRKIEKKLTENSPPDKDDPKMSKSNPSSEKLPKTLNERTPKADPEEPKISSSTKDGIEPTPDTCSSVDPSLIKEPEEPESATQEDPEKAVSLAKKIESVQKEAKSSKNELLEEKNENLSDCSRSDSKESKNCDTVKESEKQKSIVSDSDKIKSSKDKSSNGEKPTLNKCNKVDEITSKTKRKLFETSNLVVDDCEEKESSQTILKRVKRTHTSESPKSPILRSANAISSSLSSSLLEKLEKSKSKSIGKRKLGSPEHGTNDSKCPKKESERAKEETNPEELNETLDESELEPEQEEASLNRIHSVEQHSNLETYMSTTTIDLPEIDEVDSVCSAISHLEEKPYQKIVVEKEEEDRRHVISNIEALEADQKRNEARAQKLLQAFDESDDE